MTLNCFHVCDSLSVSFASVILEATQVRGRTGRHCCEAPEDAAAGRTFREHCACGPFNVRPTVQSASVLGQETQHRHSPAPEGMQRIFYVSSTARRKHGRAARGTLGDDAGLLPPRSMRLVMPAWR